jgi:hypothetical protein
MGAPTSATLAETFIYLEHTKSLISTKPLELVYTYRALANISHRSVVTVKRCQIANVTYHKKRHGRLPGNISL